MRSIAARLGISRNTVAKAVSSDSPPAYVRAPQESGIRAVEPAIRTLLQGNPRMPATVLAERVGWSGYTARFRENVARIRPEYAPADPAHRITYDPGDQAQCDLWFPEVRIPVGAGKARVLPVLVMVSSHSRFIMVLATRIVQVKPFDPESKGVVERANQFLETSFLPGRVFASPDDFNTQLGQWLPKANARLVRRTGARPSDLLAVDKAAMMALPPVPPVTGFTLRVRLPRDYYVRMGSNNYSVHPQAIGRFVDVTAGRETVRISLDGRPVGTHTRSWGADLTITNPEHVEAARVLRKAFQTPQPLGEATGLRDLADYDRAFGVVLDDGQVA